MRPNPPEKTRPIRVVLVAGPKDHGPGEHDYPAWQKAWTELLADGRQHRASTTADDWPRAEQLEKADVDGLLSSSGDWDAEAGEGHRRLPGARRRRWSTSTGPSTAATTPPGFAKRIGLAWQGGQIEVPPRPARPRLQPGRSTRSPATSTRSSSSTRATGSSPATPKDRVDVLATGEEEGQPQPLFWTLEQGKGRVFVSIPGHYSWTFDDPLFRVLLLRGIAWAAREPVDRFNELVWPGAACR